MHKIHPSRAPALLIQVCNSTTDGALFERETQNKRGKERRAKLGHTAIFRFFSVLSFYQTEGLEKE